MVLGNGFISHTIQEVEDTLRTLIKGNDLRIAPLPTTAVMTYYVTDIGEMFGCQKMRNMYLTKPLRIEKRYSIGCNIRYSLGGGKQTNGYMQNIMYCTFILGYWIDDLEVSFKDGNQYNYDLSNLYVKDKEFPQILYDNLYRLKDVYNSHFLDVAWFIRKYYDIPLDTCKDIASNVFYYLADFGQQDENNFIGLWKDMCRKRSIDYLKTHIYPRESLFYDNGDCKFGADTKILCKIDSDIAFAKLKRKRSREIISLYCQGARPIDIADELGVTLSSVSSYLCRDLKMLRTALA